MTRPTPSVKQTQQKQAPNTSQSKPQEQSQPNWVEVYLKEIFTQSGVVLPPLLNFPETVVYPNSEIKVTYRVLDGALYRLYIVSLLVLYGLAAFLAVGIGGEDGSWLALPVIVYFALDMWYMPKANRGFKQWWLGRKSFQQYWQNKCLQWIGRQVIFTFDTQQIIITNQLFNIVFHQDLIERESVERSITGSFVGFYVTPPQTAEMQVTQELAQRPVLKSCWEWMLPMPVTQGDLHLKLFVSDQPLNILHAPQLYADLLHRRLQSILTGQCTAHDINEMNRRKK